MAKEPNAQASAPMLRSDSQDRLPEIHDASERRHRRFVSMSRLASPTAQLCLVFLIYVLCAGLYWNIFSTFPYFQGTIGSALAYTSSSVRATEYALPCIVALLSGILINKFGPKYSLLAGCVGYPLKIAAYLCYAYVHPDDCFYRYNKDSKYYDGHTWYKSYPYTKDCVNSEGFIAFAGVVLVICQGISGSVVPYVMLSYPTEGFKGRAIAWFLGLWSLCALIGASVSLWWSSESTQIGYYATYDAQQEPRGMLYAPFLVLATLGTCLCWLIKSPRSVREGTVSSESSRPRDNWSNLTFRLLRDVFANPYMLSLLPMFFVSTWFYGYQFAKANNNIQFTQRAQALNLVLYWAMSVAGSIVFGAALDTHRMRRKVRARFAWLVLVLLTIPVWSGGSVFQTRVDSYLNIFLVASKYYYGDPLDPGQASYWGPAALFMFYGLHSAAWQVVSYWVIGTLADDDRSLANYAGAYNAAQSAGNAAIWRLVSPGAYVVGFATPSTRSVFDAVLALAIASLFIATPAFFLGVRDSTSSNHSHEEIQEASEEDDVAVGSPAEDAALSTVSGGVALPRRPDDQIPSHPHSTMSLLLRWATYLMVVIIVLLPIVLATLGTLVNTGGSDGCLPDGTFAIPGNFDIWNPQYILSLTVGFGYGGQAFLTWTSYKVLTQYLVCLMEHEGVTTRTYTAVAFHTGSLEGAWMLVRELAGLKGFKTIRNLAMMVYVGIYLLVFPAVLSAMTAYAPIGIASVNFYLGSDNVSRLFSEFELVNQTAGIWTYHNETNITTKALLENGSCKPTNYYRWGFSYLMLFILAVASSIFVLLLILLQRRDGLESSVGEADCYAPGLWRSVMDLSSHARSVINEEDMERLANKDLKQKLKDSRMAFDKDDIAAVQSALAAAEDSSNHTGGSSAREDKRTASATDHIESLWRRRKRSHGYDMYQSLPAQYEGFVYTSLAPLMREKSYAPYDKIVCFFKICKMGRKKC